MPHNHHHSRVGVYVDVANIYSNGGNKMQYDVLRLFACRDGGEAVRLNAYVTYDATRARRDITYQTKTKNFYSALRDLGYKVMVKEVRWYEDESGNRFGKANADLDLAVDALLQSEKLDRVMIVSGDGDFTRVVQALQNKGCRVEVVGLDNVSSELKQSADMYMSGYLIPNLIPSTNSNGSNGSSGGPTDRPVEWGELKSRVRGWCYWHSEQGYGFLRYLKHIAPGLWLTDTRHPDSPYGTAYFHDSNLPSDLSPGLLPNRNLIFEFCLEESDRGGGVKACDLAAVTSP